MNDEKHVHRETKTFSRLRRGFSKKIENGFVVSIKCAARQHCFGITNLGSKIPQVSDLTHKHLN